MKLLLVEDDPSMQATLQRTLGRRGIHGLSAGADDYLSKPFDLDELEARLRALRRRHQPAGADAPAGPQPVGGLRYEIGSGAICHRAEVLESGLDATVRLPLEQG